MVTSRHKRPEITKSVDWDVFSNKRTNRTRALICSDITCIITCWENFCRPEIYFKIDVCSIVDTYEPQRDIMYLRTF